jgi:hypothetical protein
LSSTEVVNPTNPKPREPSTELAKPIPVEIVTLLDIDQLAEAHKKFEEFKHRILTRDDWVVIQGRNFLKKSAWRKWALGCAVSDEIVSLERIPAEGKTKDGEFQYRVISKAIHRPTDRSSIGVAVASNKEKANWAHEEHDVLTLAHTRSKNRAISDLVGGGEVSAEEMISAEREEEHSREHSEVGTTEQAKVPASTTPSPEPASHDIKSTRHITTPSQQKPTMKETPADRPTQVEGWEVPLSIETPTMPGLEREIIKRDGHNVGTRLILDDEAAFIVARPVDPKDSALTSFLQSQILEAMKDKHQGEFQYQYVIENDLFHALLVRAKDRKEILSLNSPASWAFLKALTRETKKGAA